MIIWINGAFGAGKTTAAFELHRRLPGSKVYDPENAGFFIRKNTGGLFSGGDFQDIPLWREINRRMLGLISESYDGTIIVPMTIVNRQYYDEIIGALQADGIDVRHFILCASEATLRRRLRYRLSSLRGGDTFALGSIARCLDAFENTITQTKIMTDDKQIDEVVEEIARLGGLSIEKDNRPIPKKLWDRAATLIRHIRG